MSNLVRNSLYGAVVLLALYGVYALVQSRPVDDRPPIIVADGSLDIEALPGDDGSPASKGKFGKGSSGKQWFLQKQTGPPPTSFTVLVAHAAGCVDLLPYPGVTSITVAYEDMQIPPTQHSLAISIGTPPGPNDALFTFDHDVTPNTDSTFKVPDVDVKSVAFKGLTCTPATGQKLKFIVFQKH
jgi:hypothetical protein